MCHIRNDFFLKFTLEFLGLLECLFASSLISVSVSHSLSLCTCVPMYSMYFPVFFSFLFPPFLPSSLSFFPWIDLESFARDGIEQGEKAQFSSCSDYSELCSEPETNEQTGEPKFLHFPIFPTTTTSLPTTSARDQML